MYIESFSYSEGEGKMAIIFSEETKEFHLFNQHISYIIKVLPDGQLGNLYFGKNVRHRKDFSYLLEGSHRPLAVYTKEKDYFYSPQYTRLEYPTKGTGDFREPALTFRKDNGGSAVRFRYQKHEIYEGKRELSKLPALYVEEKEEAESLEIFLEDPVTNISCVLKYSIYRDYPTITRSVMVKNSGERDIFVEKIASASLDLPDVEYEMIQLSGAWARERKVITRPLTNGIQGISSRCGISSSEQNPFVALKRKTADEMQGEVIGLCLVYSGNHLEQVEVDSLNMTRVQIGIHPEGFEWKLKQEESFQSPEAVLVYSENGINGMSQVFHKIFRTRLVRGFWRDKERPILINNWEATGAAFTQEQILKIAKAGKKLGMELFVLDDGWFGKRDDDSSGLGDWYVTNFTKLPGGIKELANNINSLGMKFGLWFEPEMVNKDSDLFRKHPEWILQEPGYVALPSRNQYILDYTKNEVRDYIYNLMERVLSEAPISYVKWDMNRYMSDCYSTGKEPDEQGKVMHLYILGVYELYERLRKRFPKILFESCSSGGARFDPGMLYYAPQTWTSDNTDAMDRVKIQYGTSYVYPLSSMGAHVSEVPNQQVGRITPLETRGNVAQFGMFGYEMDLDKMTEQEKEIVKSQVEFAKQHRRLVMTGLFYRLLNPFELNDGAWMVVSEDKTEALVGFYRMSGQANGPWIRLRLAGLDENKDYQIEGQDNWYSGSELMNIGMVIRREKLSNQGGDYSSSIFFLKVIN